MPDHQVLLLLGSNIHPEINLLQSLDLLQKQVKLKQISGVYQSSAIGSAEQDFLNMALLAETSLTAQELKVTILYPLESRLGRIRQSDKYASRTIDIDIIVFDGQVLDKDVWSQAYKAVPSAELLPQLLSENGEKLFDKACQLEQQFRIFRRNDIKVDISKIIQGVYV